MCGGGYAPPEKALIFKLGLRPFFGRSPKRYWSSSRKVRDSQRPSAHQMAEPLGVQVMTTKQEQHLLSDHVDMRLVGVESDEGTIDRNAIVQLNADHPGFRDQEYRARRNQIAQLAMNYRPGDPIPDAPYTPDEHRVWQTIWKALGPAHQKHACAEYLSALDRLSFAPERIPQLREVNEKVQAISGFRLEPMAPACCHRPANLKRCMRLNCDRLIWMPHQARPTIPHTFSQCYSVRIRLRRCIRCSEITW